MKNSNSVFLFLALASLLGIYWLDRSIGFIGLPCDMIGTLWFSQNNFNLRSCIYTTVSFSKEYISELRMIDLFGKILRFIFFICIIIIFIRKYFDNKKP